MPYTLKMLTILFYVVRERSVTGDTCKDHQDVDAREANDENNSSWTSR